MSYKIDTIASFRREAKKLIKKYPSLKKELQLLGLKLSENPTIGTPLGNNCFKIRMAIKSKRKGKSGGARVITHVVHVSDQVVYMLTIFDKSSKENIADKELQELLKSIE
ncbi:MAG: type II toxin-antitoxin system RelE/ParE family toxin [Cyclobacteriaceae bacterium]